MSCPSVDALSSISCPWPAADLRHTFAVRRVQLWHDSGVSVDQGMLWLCTYLGHAKISDTYWYLTGTPELLAVVGSTFERFAFNPEVAHA